MVNERQFSRIADYGLIGNRRSAALVSRRGSIDWCCFPRFDSPSAFAALLDVERGGCFRIAPTEEVEGSQRYVDETCVLETTFETGSGVCIVTDCMPFYDDGRGGHIAPSQLIRLVRCLRGSVELEVLYQPRLDYARAAVQLRRQGTLITLRRGDEGLQLASPMEMLVAGGDARGRLTLAEGEEMEFVLTYEGPEVDDEPSLVSATQALAKTLESWRSVAEGLDYQGPWKTQVLRSYLTLCLMTYLPTGGIVAAPTTSLPEALGGIRNWDYRYTWLRDAAFTVDAMLCVGHLNTAVLFFNWLSQVCSAHWDNFQIMYRVDAESDLEEEELAHLCGYMGSSPVRVGNAAATQVQHDIYGEVLSSALLLAEAGHPMSDDQWNLLQTLATHAANRWRQPDSGIWEVRGGLQHFVHSKVMCWVALDRAVRLARATGRDDPQVGWWEETAQAIREEVLERGWSERKGAFVQHYDGDAMDASNLLLPLVGFIAADDPRMASTVERIRAELGNGPFLQRYRTGETDDGLTGSEGAFLVCSFWLVRVLAMMGRAEEAQELFAQLMEYASPLGLYAEMVDPESKQLLGNFPQAFTHVGLILAARECGMGLAVGLPRGSV